jgi:CHAT domain-containing protein
VEVAESLFEIGLLNHSLGHLAQAEKLYKRSIEIIEKVRGPNSGELIGSVMNLGILYHWQGRLAEAERELRRALAITNDANLSTVLDSLVGVYISQRRYDEAEPHERRALDIRLKTLGPDHPNIATSLDSLATINIGRGRLRDALPLLERETAVFENTYGKDHPWVASTLSRRAFVTSSLGDLSAAAELLQRAIGITVGQQRRDIESLGRPLTISGQTGSGGLRSVFPAYIQVSALLDRKPGTRADAGKMLEMAQWSTASAAAASIAKMAARTAKGSSELAGLVRERQDLVAEWTEKAQKRMDLRSEPVERRDVRLERQLAERSAQIDVRLAQIDQTLKKAFPDYEAYASPEPLGAAEIQSFLGDDEALVFLLPTAKWGPAPEQTFVWVVTKSELRWARSDLGPTALADEVAALRCGLDDEAWRGTGRERCSNALGIPPVKKTPDPLPYEHTRAYKLHKALLGEVQDLIKGKHLLVVPSGPLIQLPFHVLVTESPRTASHRAAAWLVRSHAVTVLPTVASLKALRRARRPSAAQRKPMIGFGNPLLDGYPGGPTDDAEAAQIAKDHAEWAAEAREHQQCPETLQQVAAHTGSHLGVARIQTRRGLADVAYLRRQTPLPETADELCTVAHAVQADARDIHLGAQATEGALKALSRNGDLARYRMVLFATHGAMAGEIDGTHEPGLILTPPATATEEDDGYLSASEIATLKLDADWVILSACNTAAGGAANAEALSGMARAFIYAQARALLVSHWAVYSDATVSLITTAVSEMARDTRVGPAEAMRRSMLALIEKGSPEQAHPAYWAPFVVVGEGAAGR